MRSAGGVPAVASLEGRYFVLTRYSWQPVPKWCGPMSTPNKTPRTAQAGGRESASGRMPKRILEGNSQEERVKQRRTLGTLKQLTVQPSTRKRYDVALQQFFDFLRSHHLVLPTNLKLMDNLASDYMEHLWATGAGRARAADTLASLQDQQPQLKGQLGGAWRLLRAWNQTELPNRAPPMPLEVLDAMVGLALFRKQPLFALSLLVGFYGLLRTGEILNICKSHVAVAQRSSSVLISLGFTKGGKRHGASESVKLTVQDVIRRMQQWVEDPCSSSSLTPPSHVWRNMFSDYLDTLGFSELRFRPYTRLGGVALHLCFASTAL